MKAALFLVLVSAASCESDAPTIAVDAEPDAAIMQQQIDRTRAATADELERLEKRAAAATPQLPAADAGQKSGVNE